MYGLGKRTVAKKEAPSAPPKKESSASGAEAAGLPTQVTDASSDAAPPVPLKKEQESLIIRSLCVDSRLTDLLFSKLAGVDLIRLRSTCRECQELVLEYMKRLLMQTSFLSDPSLIGFSDMDFWLPAMRFFFKHLVHLTPINRLTYTPVVAALRANREQGFPVGSYQARSHCSIALDHLPPPLIQACVHEFPQRHTTSLKRKLDVPSRAVSDVITRTQFIAEYCRRIQPKIYDDELVWIPMEYAAQLCRNADDHFIGLFLETFLRGIEDIISLRRGRLVFRRTEYIANGGFMLHHRIWTQIMATWGWEDARPYIQKLLAQKAMKPEAKKPVPKVWSVRGVPSGKTSLAKISKPIEKKKETPKAKAEPPIPPGHYPQMWLTIIDHFQWDS